MSKGCNFVSTCNTHIPIHVFFSSKPDISLFWEQPEVFLCLKLQVIKEKQNIYFFKLITRLKKQNDNQKYKARA